jgi:hypothetical protein
MQRSLYPPALIPCNAGSISFGGGAGIYYAEAIVLGNAIGPVTASFNAQNVPDRFRLVWSGSTVADSLFVGDGLASKANYDSYTASISNVTSLTRYDFDNQQQTFIQGNSEAVSYSDQDFPPYNLSNTRGNGTPTGNHGNQIGVLPNIPAANSYSTDGNVDLCFYKNTELPTTFTIIIDGPNGGTAWDLFSVSCPT